MEAHEEGRKLLVAPGEEQQHYQLHPPKKDNQNHKERPNVFRQATFGRATHRFL